MENVSESKIKRLKLIIWTLSIVIPVVVALLFGIKVEGFDTSFLPPMYATINGITALLLISALVAIKNKRVKLHESLVKVAIFCSVLFLIGYVVYHITSDPTPYGDKDSPWFLVYIVLLVAHILLSIVVIPLVLFTYMHAYLGRFEKHRKLAKITFPIWLFVAVSGVVVYLMISPYYVQ